MTKPVIEIDNIEAVDGGYRVKWSSEHEPQPGIKAETKGKIYIKHSDLKAHVKGYNLNMVERWDNQAGDLDQTYLDLDTYIEENLEDCIKHYLLEN